MSENNLTEIARALEQRTSPQEMSHALRLLTTEIRMLRDDIAVLTTIVKHRALGLEPAEVPRHE